MTTPEEECLPEKLIKICAFLPCLNKVALGQVPFTEVVKSVIPHQ